MGSKDVDKGQTGLSRRGFLKGVGAGAVATGLVQGKARPKKVNAQGLEPTVGPGSLTITLNINGKKQKVEVEPRVTLLDALRNRLDLTGTKKVCDRGTCGACTVMIDGELGYSCSMLAVEAVGRKITTIEALGTPDNLSNVQESFIEHDASQCGFCTPGFVLATTDFLKKNPNATLDEVREGMGGNLCRCGTYAGIIQVALNDNKTYQKGGA